MANKQAENKTVENVVAKDAFLATLGFYGKAYDNASALITERKSKREEQFKDFVARGTAVESRIKDKIEAFRNEDNKINAGITNIRESYTKLATKLKLKKAEDTAEA